MNREKCQNIDSKKQQLSTLNYIGYSAPELVASFLVMPAAAIVPGIYAKYYGLELTAIATAVLVAKLFDGFSDPIVGYLSDRSRERTGSRKPWVISGGLLLVLCAYFLFSPSQKNVSITYFLFWYIAFYLAWTVYYIPHVTWGGELTTDYEDRAKVYGYRTTFQKLGFLSFYGLPFLPLFSTSEFTPETLRISVLVGLVLMLLSLLLLWRFSPDKPIITNQKRETLGAMLEAIFQNRPLLIFVATYFLTGLGLGMWSGLQFIYLDGYLGLGSQVSTIFLTGSLVTLATIPLWMKSIEHIGKAATWTVGMTFFAISMAGFWGIKPGTGVLLPLILMLVLFSGAACQAIVTPSILADIVDYGIWKFGRDRGGSYFAFYTLVVKVNAGIGAALGLGIAGLFGFDPGAGSHSDEAVFGLRLAFVVIPILLVTVSIGFIVKTPINKRRHAIIRRRLETRERRGNSRLQSEPRKKKKEPDITSVISSLSKTKSY